MEYSKGNIKVLNKKRGIRVAKMICALLNEYLPNLKKNPKVLDIGCSSGIISEYIANYLEKTSGLSEYIGTEVDREALAKASKIKKSKMKFLMMDGTELKFKNEAFDLVVLWQVHIFLKNQKKLYDEIYRVLRPGGIVLLSGSNAYNLTKPKEPVPTFYKSLFQLKKLLPRFEILYQTNKVFEYKFGFRLVLPRLFWEAAEIINPNFIWILVKP